MHAHICDVGLIKVAGLPVCILAAKQLEFDISHRSSAVQLSLHLLTFKLRYKFTINFKFDSDLPKLQALHFNFRTIFLF